MFRIDNSSSVTIAPQIPAAGIPGFFVNGNPRISLEATIVDDWWLNQLQEEILTVVEYAGLIPSKTNHRQLLEALQHLGLGAGQEGFLPLSGGTLAGPGDLTVSGSFTVHGASNINALAINGNDALTLFAQATQNARINFAIPTRHWSVGVTAEGGYWCTDHNAGQSRYNIDTAGNFTIFQRLRVPTIDVDSLLIRGGLVFPGYNNHSLTFGFITPYLGAWVDGNFQGYLVTNTFSGAVSISGNFASQGQIQAAGALLGSSMVVTGTSAFGGVMEVHTGIRFSSGPTGQFQFTWDYAQAEAHMTVDGSSQGRLVKQTNAFVITAGGFSTTGLLSGGALNVNIGGANNVTSTAINGRVVITSDGARGVQILNSSLYVDGGIGVNAEPMTAVGSVNVSNTYYRAGQPIPVLDPEIQDMMELAPDGSMFLISKISTDRFEAIRVEAGAELAELRGRRPLYLVMAADDDEPTTKRDV